VQNLARYKHRNGITIKGDRIIMRKITALLLTVTLSLGLLSNVSYGASLNSIISKYNLKKIGKVPSGIKVTKCTISQLETNLKKLTAYIDKKKDIR
jgi:hypothetical protein